MIFNILCWIVLLHLWHPALSQTGQRPTLTINQHDTHHDASFLCPDLSGNFRPLINRCKLVFMYWSCLECCKPGFNLDCVHFGGVYNENVLFHMWLQRELWPKTAFFLGKLAGSGFRSRFGLLLQGVANTRVTQIWSLNRLNQIKSYRDNCASISYDPDTNTGITSDIMCDQTTSKANILCIKYADVSLCVVWPPGLSSRIIWTGEKGVLSSFICPKK